MVRDKICRLFSLQYQVLTRYSKHNLKLLLWNKIFHIYIIVVVCGVYYPSGEVHLKISLIE